MLTVLVTAKPHGLACMVTTPSGGVFLVDGLSHDKCFHKTAVCVCTLLYRHDSVILKAKRSVRPSPSFGTFTAASGLVPVQAQQHISSGPGWHRRRGQKLGARLVNMSFRSHPAALQGILAWWRHDDTGSFLLELQSRKRLL